MSERNRAQGWKHAKITGHQNEALLESIVEKDSALQRRILSCAGNPNGIVHNIDFGGLREQDVDCVLGGKTKSKTDMHIYLNDGNQINVSIKKSAGGQVYLIGVDRFMDGFETQFKKTIPENVKRAISLYWGTANDTKEIVEKYGSRNKAYELRKHRLTKETLDAYDPKLSGILLDWINANIKEIFCFCFAAGLAADHKEWANIIWYRNELAENDMDDMFAIGKIVEKLSPTAEYGTRTGGSTIQLPFGFVQWHSPTKTIPGCMQFHHSFEKISELMR